MPSRSYSEGSVTGPQCWREDTGNRGPGGVWLTFPTLAETAESGQWEEAWNWWWFKNSVSLLPHQELRGDRPWRLSPTSGSPLLPGAVMGRSHRDSLSWGWGGWRGQAVPRSQAGGRETAFFPSPESQRWWGGGEATHRPPPAPSAQQCPGLGTVLLPPSVLSPQEPTGLLTQGPPPVTL